MGGNLIITQDIAYTGDTVVSAGTFSAAGLRTSANITVNDGGTLTASSLICDTLTVTSQPSAVPELGALVLLVLAGLAFSARGIGHFCTGPRASVTGRRLERREAHVDGRGPKVQMPNASATRKSG